MARPASTPEPASEDAGAKEGRQRTTRPACRGRTGRPARSIGRRRRRERGAGVLARKTGRSGGGTSRAGSGRVPVSCVEGARRELVESTGWCGPRWDRGHMAWVRAVALPAPASFNARRRRRVLFVLATLHYWPRSSRTGSATRQERCCALPALHAWRFRAESIEF